MENIPRIKPDKLPPEYTKEELKTLIPKVKKKIVERMEELSQDVPDIRPLPIMDEKECLQMFSDLMDLAAERPLTIEECFLHGQLIHVFRNAIRSETLKLEGKYWVVSEKDIRDAQQRQ
jgi:hypothetical protein